MAGAVPPADRGRRPESTTGFRHEVELRVAPGDYSVARLAHDAPIPSWARGRFASVTRTPDELSIVVPSSAMPAAEAVEVEAGWRLLAVSGPLDFGQIGILASLAAPLASASVPLLAISTYATDYLLVRSSDLARAVAALEEAGHVVAPGKTSAGAGAP
jgi:hypothetical protein